jgi:hypothetical protein
MNRAIRFDMWSAMDEASAEGAIQASEGTLISCAKATRRYCDGLRWSEARECAWIRCDAAHTMKEPAVTFEEIFESHPEPTSLDHHTLLRCIRECLDCAASCTACADACLSEDDLPVLVRCIRLNLDCADACDVTGRTVARQTAADLGLIGTTLKACAAACRACGEECERHAAHHEHCRLCAEVCRRCERACDDVLALID